MAAAPAVGKCGQPRHCSPSPFAPPVDAPSPEWGRLGSSRVDSVLLLLLLLLFMCVWT